MASDFLKLQQEVECEAIDDIYSKFTDIFGTDIKTTKAIVKAIEPPPLIEMKEEGSRISANLEV